MRPLALVAFLAATAAAGPASAQAPRVVLGTSAELAARIRGQTGDLPLALLDAPPPADLEAALALGRARAAPFAVFATETPPGLTVHVVEVEARRMLSRRIDAADDRSAALEAAALIVRGALRELADGGHVGVVMPAPERAIEAPPPVPERAPQPTAAVHVAVGWSATLDDHAPHGVHAPSLAGGAALDRLRLGVRVEVALPVELADAQATIALLRVRPTVLAAIDLLEHPELALTLGLELGLALWHRATEVRAPGLVATDARWSGSFLVAPQLGLEVFPTVLGGIVGLTASAGADIVPSAPTFAYAVDGATVTRAALWPVQPFLRLALAVRGG